MRERKAQATNRLEKATQHLTLEQECQGGPRLEEGWPLLAVSGADIVNQTHSDRTTAI